MQFHDAMVAMQFHDAMVRRSATDFSFQRRGLDQWLHDFAEQGGERNKGGENA